VILSAYKEWGTNCFSKFNGMWAIALLDEIKDEVIICRDNFGIKPVFYGFNEDCFFAGSEIKQFRHFYPQFDLNFIQAYEYLNSGLLNFNENTFFKDIFELRPGCLIQINASSLQFSKTQWYSNSIDIFNASYSDCREQISCLLKDSVNIRLRSDVSVGSCLSGGIDSSCLVSIIASEPEFNKSAFFTFTAFYDDEASNELEFSDEVVRVFDIENIKIKPDLGSAINNKILDKIILHQEQPFSSMSNYSQYEVYKLAKKNDIVVLIDGQGADEYFLGYNIFRLEYLKDTIKKLKFYDLFRFVKMYASINKISFLKSIKTLLFDPLLFIPFISLFKKRKIKLFSKDFEQKLSGRYEYKELSSLVQDQMFRSNLPALLHSADRNSMMFSIETRLPILDYRLFEYVSNMPQDFLFTTGYSKSILRESVESLPLKIKLRRDKMGFESPTKQFVIDNAAYFREQISELLNQFSSLNKDLLNSFDSFVEGISEYDEVFFRLFAMNRFLNVFDLKCDVDNPANYPNSEN
jgi:asparagine synthase (glutamine-hydrolysing)